MGPVSTTAPSRPASAGALIGFYALYFGTVGITLPFLPQYLKSLGFSATQIGILLGTLPFLAMASPPLFGHLADRTGRPDRILSVVCFGAFLGFLPLVRVSSFPAVLACVAAYAFFASSTTTLVDSLALKRIEARGGAYAHLRVWGSVGFIIAAAAFGLSVTTIDRRAVYAAVTGMGLFSLWSLGLRAQSAPAPRMHPAEALRLLRNRDLAIFLGATCLHWISCAPYHGSFSIHVTALGLSPSIVGVGAAIGVCAEVGVMLLYPSLAKRFAPRHLLFVAFAGTALRWVGMALTSSGPVIIALSTLHGLTFGAFYMASVAYMARRVPPHLRASGQALFAAITFGIGGVIGYFSAGVAYDVLLGHKLFAVAAGVELVAALLVLGVRPPPDEPVGISTPVPASGPG